MRGNRLFIIIGVVLLLIALGGIAFYLMQQRGPQQPTAELEGEGTSIPEIPQIEIVVAAQDLSRGMELTAEMTEGAAPAVQLKPWPEDSMPDGAITDLEDIYDRTVHSDVPRGMPILLSMLREGPSGSVASLQIPEEKVGYVLPVTRYSSVAWALQPGDSVDVIISFLLVDVDEEFQSIEPNQAQCFSPAEDPACAGMSGPMGRLEVLPNGWLVNLKPSESQRPRLVSQVTVQNATVLRVGDWPIVGGEETVPSRGEAVMEEVDGEAQTDVEDTPSAEMTTRPSVAPLTLAVTREEAMILDYAQLAKAHITLVLRGLDDDGTTSMTTPVTLQYLMDTYGIEMPAKLPYGIDPRITNVQGRTISPAATEGTTVEE